MKRSLVVCILLHASFLRSVHTEDQSPISLSNAYQPLAPLPSAVDSNRERPEGIDDRLLCGYQGWFRAEGDGSGSGFHHYTNGGKFEPGHCSIDLWPDLSEFDEDEKYPTLFKHGDGSTAHVFSSLNAKTVDRHFKWMADFDIDGVFVQRFATLAAKEKQSYHLVQADNRKLILCRDAANRHRRCYALMYDLTGISDDDFERLAEDWKKLRRRMQLGTDPNDFSYLHFQGKPLVAIWGVGFNDDRKYTLAKCEWLIRLLKHNPEWGGMSIMLGVPYYWREQPENSDTIPNSELHNVLKLADIISPWSVGRYRTETELENRILLHQKADLEWCRKNRIAYLPVLFPGFSWQNLKGKEAADSAIPRNGGQFLWQQFVTARATGNRSAYIAMFDEIDEGTAIFKCTNDPPIGASKFQTYDDLPTDHYLWLCQEGKRLLRGKLPVRNP